MQRTVSAELHQHLLASVAVDQVELPFDHACLVTVDHEGRCENHGDAGLRARARSRAAHARKSGDYARVFLIRHDFSLYEYDGSIIAVTVEPGWAPFAAPSRPLRQSGLASRAGGALVAHV